MRRLKPALLALPLLLVGAWQVGEGAWIHAKAWLAQALIERAWARTLAGEDQVRPWPWADTRPVARLAAPRLGVERMVLAGAEGRSLAFGPGHHPATAAPAAESGTTVIAGHRDTHFAFLRRLRPGDALHLTARDGRRQVFRVDGTRVAHEDEAMPLDPGGRRLVLVTCWPFHAVTPGTPWRYVVEAVLVNPGIP